MADARREEDAPATPGSAGPPLETVPASDADDETPVAEPRAPGLAPPGGFLGKHRARILRIGLIAVAAVVLLDLSHTLPTATTIELPLGDATGAESIALDVLGPDGDAALSLRLHYPDGAPSRLVEELELTPGTWRVRIDAERDGGTESLEGTFETPAEGAVRVALRPVR